MMLIKFPKLSGPDGIPRMRIEAGRFFADIVWDRRSQPPVYYVIVQQHGSRAVLGLAKYDTLAGARKAAEEDLQVFATKAA